MPSILLGKNINIKDFILDKYTEAKALVCSLEVIFDNGPEVPKTNKHGQQKCQDLTYPFACSPLQTVSIKESRTLSEANSDGQNSKSIMEIVLDIQQLEAEYQWQPGDTIAIMPTNSQNDVNDLLQLLDLADKTDLKCHVEVNPLSTKKNAKVPAYIPSPTTIGEIFFDCLNINSVLKKQFLSSLADYCSEDEEITFLKCLSSKEASVFYNDLIMVKGFSIIDILKLCPTCKPPLNLIIEHFGRLLPRPYSIANSPLENAKEIKIIFSILEGKPGVTTSMMVEKAKEENPSTLIYFREPNLFRYTEDDFTNNQILIAVGTGLAPFLGFLEYKQQLMARVLKSKPGQTWLFVGATTEAAVLNKDKLIKWQSTGLINKFEAVHSRGPTPMKCQYVQDAVMKCSEEFIEFLMKPQTILYLCADGGLISKCIEKTVGNILEKHLNVSAAESLQMLKEFKSTGKYREDLWI